MRRIASLLVMCAIVALAGCTQPKATNTAPKATIATTPAPATTPVVEPTKPAATKPAETKPAESKPGDKTTPPAPPK